MNLKALTFKTLGLIFYFLGGSIVIGIIHVGWKIFRRTKGGWEVLYAIILLLVAFGIGYLLIYIGQKLVVRGKKVGSIKESNTILEKLKSQRNHILYLRSFLADKITARVSTIDYRGIPIPSFTSEEENLEKAFSIAGPFVAISKPYTKLPDLGAIRIPSFDEDKWKDEAIELMQNAQIIVFRLGNTKELIWELEQALTNFDIKKVILLVPNDSVLYNELKGKIEQLIGQEIPKYIESELNDISLNAIIYFKNGLPVLVPLAHADHRDSSTIPLFPRLRIALKPFFENLQIQWTPPPIPYKLYLWFIFYLYVTGLTLGWIGIYIFSGVNPFVFFKESFWDGILWLSIYALILLLPLYIGVTGLYKYSIKIYNAVYQFNEVITPSP